MTRRDDGLSGRGHEVKVLVSAASQHGATAEIAEAIGEELDESGLSVTVADPEQVSAVDDYDAVILGSAVYAGHWLDPATDLASRLSPALAGRPVWLFSSGPVGDPARKLVRAMSSEPAEVASVRAATHARQHRIFAGKLDPKALSRAQRVALAVFRGMNGDFRDWSQIRRWARDIAAQLGAPAGA